MMTNTAYQIWETFKAELIVEPTDDMKQALASSIRELVNQLKYIGITEKNILELANELEAL
jgi:DNA-binding transcriptional regulator YhcF (GntR family)